MTNRVPGTLHVMAASVPSSTPGSRPRPAGRSGRAPPSGRPPIRLRPSRAVPSATRSDRGSPESARPRAGTGRLNHPLPAVRPRWRTVRRTRSRKLVKVARGLDVSEGARGWSVWAFGVWALALAMVRTTSSRNAVHTRGTRTLPAPGAVFSSRDSADTSLPGCVTSLCPASGQ